ncbi:hypothetical protein SAMN05444000_104132 [Shimia gijangensis]|uniref:Uncharacterized protein n=1 Tax=Shimia gijangensis TaxID=1470563 RepID=A0A1M6FPX3_9RHOB|nr:hypothetical protein [Shimia gijangensis]SHI99720.1 hypothetical protein SAMN05444000_104132 [Shimia gijangensis]
MLRQTILSALCAIGLSTAAKAEAYLDFTCIRGNSETCFVLLEGTIDKGLTERFEKFVEDEGVEGNRLIINSPGGNLAEALKFGRLLRDWEWNTRVGSSEGMFRNSDGSLDLHGLEDYPPGGRCESACAYVFMGGVNRVMHSDSLIGFHRFKAAGQTIDGESAQAISGQLISYILEMGVDARVFVVASAENSQSMYHVDAEQAREYDLVTPPGYAPFILKPYRDGIIASSERTDSIRMYDLADQISAFCKGGTPGLLVRSKEHGLTGDEKASLWAMVDEQEFEYPASSVKLIVSDEAAFISATIDDAMANAMLEGQELFTAFGFANYAGGEYSVNLILSDMDRQMLAAAFRYCIG